MKYKFVLARRFLGFHAGSYRVPEDLAEDLAQRAMNEGAGYKFAPKVAPENKVVRPPENKEPDPTDAPGPPSPPAGTVTLSSSRRAGRRSRKNS